MVRLRRKDFRALELIAESLAAVFIVANLFENDSKRCQSNQRHRIFIEVSSEQRAQRCKTGDRDVPQF